MGTLIEIVVTGITAACMGVVPILVKWLVQRLAQHQTVNVEIRDSSGLRRVIKLRKDMSPEEVRAVSQELTTVIEAQK